MPKLMQKSKSFYSDLDIKVYDITLFIKHESTIASKYLYGMVHDDLPKRDGIIQKSAAKYRNDQKNVDRFTTHSVGEIGLIHQVDELNLMKKLEKWKLLLT